MDAAKHIWIRPFKIGAFTRALLYVAGFVLYLSIPFLLHPESINAFEGGEGLLFLALFLAPWVQLFRFPLLRRLLREEHWGKRAMDAARIDWFASLITGAYLALPLTNMALMGGYTGSLLFRSEWPDYIYGQTAWVGWRYGNLTFFAALALAVAVDILILWAFALLRKRAFKPSLRAALIVNAAIYIPITLLFLMPYIAHKWGG
jgi:hypothetical protein